MCIQWWNQKSIESACTPVMGHLHHRVEQPKPDETAIADPSQLERGRSTKRSFIKPKSVSFICKSDMKEVDVCLCI